MAKKEAPGQVEGQEVRVRPDLKRLGELITVDQYFLLREQEVGTVVEVLSEFVVDEVGQYVVKEEGRKQLGRMKVKEVLGLFTRFMAEAEEIAVPLG